MNYTSLHRDFCIKVTYSLTKLSFTVWSNNFHEPDKIRSTLGSVSIESLAALGW